MVDDWKNITPPFFNVYIRLSCVHCFIRHTVVGVFLCLSISRFMTVVAANLSGLSQQIQVFKQTMDALCTRVDQVVSMSPADVVHGLVAAEPAIPQSVEPANVSLDELKHVVGRLCDRHDKLEASFVAVYGSRPVIVAGGCGRRHNLSMEHLRHTPLYDLYWASSSGCVACVRALLPEVSDVNGASISNGWTALDFMLWGQNEAVAGIAHPVGHDSEGVRELLLKAGCKKSSEML